MVKFTILFTQGEAYFFHVGSPSGFFFGWGREAKNTVLPESFFYIQIFSLFFILHFFTFLHFLHFQIFSLFYIFTILQFFRGHSSRCFFLCGEMLKNFLGGVGVRWTRLFFKKMGGGPDWSNSPTTGDHKYAFCSNLGSLRTHRVQ